MKKVWLVSYGAHEDYVLLAIWSTEEKAKACRDEYNKANIRHIAQWGIDVVEVELDSDISAGVHNEYGTRPLQYNEPQYG